MKFSKIYKPYMLRPIVYKTFSRFIIALIPALLWERFIPHDPALTAAEHAFPVVGIILIAMAWFHYLSLDGIKIHEFGEKRQKNSKHKQRDIVDFANEKIISFDELDHDERTLCKMIANLLSGGAMVTVSLLASFLL